MKLKRKPEWLRTNFKNIGKTNNDVKEILSRFSLNTVCQAANCPNKMECFSKKTATFMILGSKCTRNCSFCDVENGRTEAIDENEPKNLADAVLELGLKHVVITSVTRDDLEDGGAGHFAKVVREIKKRDENIVVEVLIPDLKGNKDALRLVVDSKPEIINHNIETVPRLYKEVRLGAIYKRSLEVLKNIKEMDKEIYSKCGIMVGLGETEEEVVEVMKDLRAIECDFLTVGQYLPPSLEHIELKEYISPLQFKKYKDIGMDLGFGFVASSPLVRSSYKASDMMQAKK